MAEAFGADAAGFAGSFLAGLGFVPAVLGFARPERTFFTCDRPR
jgi:hypothetical protein